ncbi:amino acid permease [Brevibacterium oceani]|uniref:amino acid permease n=1 Tax=Brevibacterium oceani TaxID=358099 RepID=UPI001FE8D91E|nr:amino acid permease [Brevibacterium oceani]
MTDSDTPSTHPTATSAGVLRQLGRRKSIGSMVTDARIDDVRVDGSAQIDDGARVDGNTEGSGRLRRTFGVFQLTMISVGATLGTGILVILGEAVPVAGPAVWLAFVLAGVTALLSAVSYAEMAGMVPVSGSSYSYSYATLGEGVAWICGWCLVLEYAVSVAAVAVGAADYVNETLRVFGLELPGALTTGPGVADNPGGVINVSALVVVALATVLLMRGAKESGIVNTILVFVKLGILVFFAIVAFTAFKAGNFAPMLPMGAAGVTAAASSVFFSYIGFDAASTAGEEAKNPRRDLPRAIILSMLIVTAMYVLVAVAAIGARQWQWFAGAQAPLVQIVEQLTGSNLAVLLFAVAAVLAIFSVVITVLYGQSRILLTMARDGMVPKIFGVVSRRTGTPVAGTLIVGGLVAITAALIPLGELADATSIGTLFAFFLVNLAVIYLRVKRPDLERSFTVPFGPVIPALGALACAFLMLNLGGRTWAVFGVWMAVGALVYFTYSRRHSVVGAMDEATYRTTLTP